MNKGRRTYTGEFKQEAVRLYQSSGKTMAEVERELGLRRPAEAMGIRRRARWRGSVSEPRHLKGSDEQVRRLERELALVKEERDILKKAVAIFAQVNRRNSGS